MLLDKESRDQLTPGPKSGRGSVLGCISPGVTLGSSLALTDFYLLIRRMDQGKRDLVVGWM